MSYNLGDWIESEQGYGQILSIQNLYWEACDQPVNEGRKEGDFLNTYAIIKVFCDFEGNIRRRKLITYFLLNDIDIIPDKGMNMVNDVRINNPKDYMRYLLWDEKQNLSNVIRLFFMRKSIDINEVEKSIALIRSKLLPIFSYKEFVCELKKSNLPFKLSDAINLNFDYTIDDSFALALYNPMFKVRNKKKLFDWVQVIRFDNI